MIKEFCDRCRGEIVVGGKVIVELTMVSREERLTLEQTICTDCIQAPIFVRDMMHEGNLKTFDKFVKEGLIFHNDPVAKPDTEGDPA